MTSWGRTAGERGRVERRGAILVETLLAVTILAISLTLLGSQFNAAARMARMAELHNECMVLAERKLAELESFNIDASTDELEGDFGEVFPYFTWEITVDGTAVPKLYLVHVQIKYNDGYDTYSYRLHTLKAEPARFSLTRDFGLSEEQTQQVQQELPIEGIDLGGEGFTLAELGDLDIDAIMQLLPQLMTLLNSGAFGDAFGPEQLRNLTSAMGGLGIPNMDGLLQQFGDIGGLANDLRESGRRTGGQPNPFGGRGGSSGGNLNDLVEQIGGGAGAGAGADTGGGRRRNGGAR